MQNPSSYETSPDATATRPKPPGGKVLLRLVSRLDHAGLTHLADQALTAAVDDEQRASVDDLRAARRTRSSTADEPPPASDGVSSAPDAAPATSDAHVPDPGVETALANAEAVELLAQERGGPRWKFLGPSTIRNGETSDDDWKDAAGRVSCIAVDPDKSEHLLCGSAAGGVWESHDGGSTWEPRTDEAGTLTVGAICFVGQNNTVLCGTGEGNYWFELGQGVLRSIDGGTTWSPLCTDPFVGDGFYDLLVDPNEPTRLVAGTRKGLWVSRDGGEHWDSRHATTCWSIAALRAPGEPTRWLAACPEGVLESTDDGATWLAGHQPAGTTVWERAAIATAPSDSSVAFLWVCDKTTARLFRRESSQWVELPRPPESSIYQAWYNWCLAIAPDDADRIFVGGQGCSVGRRSGTNVVWESMSAVRPGSNSLNPDIHAIAVDPKHPDTVLLGSDGGLYISRNGGVDFDSLNRGLAIAEVEYLAGPPNTDKALLAGTQDNGTLLYTGSATWKHVNDGDGGDCGVLSGSIFFCTQDGLGGPRVFRSTGGGSSSWVLVPPEKFWNRTTRILTAQNKNLMYPPLETCPNSDQVVAVGTSSIWVSRDSGITWTDVPLPGAVCSALCIPDPDHVYAGCTDGRVFRTTWADGMWSQTEQLGCPRADAFVSDLEVDPAVTTLWLTHGRVGGGRVWTSSDGGATWSDRTLGLPDIPMNAVKVDAGNPSRVWVAGNVGVYESCDSGTSWCPRSNGLPHAMVGDLVFEPTTGLLRAGTRSRGVWQLQVSSS